MVIYYCLLLKLNTCTTLWLKKRRGGQNLVLFLFIAENMRIKDLWPCKGEGITVSPQYIILFPWPRGTGKMWKEAERDDFGMHKKLYMRI